MRTAEIKYHNKKNANHWLLQLNPRSEFISTKEVSWKIAKLFNNEHQYRDKEFSGGNRWTEYREHGYHTKGLTQSHKASFSRSLKRLTERGLIILTSEKVGEWKPRKKIYKKYIKLN
ncbi:MAG: hypothetical protein ACTSRG_20225 [Candidatus Helarchaeota archaeon]